MWVMAVLFGDADHFKRCSWSWVGRHRVWAGYSKGEIYIWRCKIPSNSFLLILEWGHRNNLMTPSCHECLYPHRDRLVQGCWLGLGLTYLATGGSKLSCSPCGGIPWILGPWERPQAPGPILVCSVYGLGLGFRKTCSLPSQCVGPRQLMRKEAAEPSGPEMSTGAFRSVPSRRALSLASASCSESLARAMNRRPDSTITSQAQVHHYPSQCLSGGSGGARGLCMGRPGQGQGLGWEHGEPGTQSCFCL